MSAPGSCTISIEGIRVFAHHGVLPEEKSAGQVFLIDVELDLLGVPGDDSLSSTVDYAQVAQDVTDMATGRSYDLIETLARDIAGSLLQHPLVRKASVKVSKPEAPMGVPVESVSVTVSMERSGSRGYFTGEGEDQ